MTPMSRTSGIKGGLKLATDFLIRKYVAVTSFRAGFLLLYSHVKLHLLYKVLVFADSSALRVPSWCYEQTVLSLIPSLMHRRLWTRIILHNCPACCQKGIYRILQHIFFLVLALSFVYFQSDVSPQQTNGCQSTCQIKPQDFIFD